MSKQYYKVSPKGNSVTIQETEEAINHLRVVAPNATKLGFKKGVLIQIDTLDLTETNIEVVPELPDNVTITSIITGDKLEDTITRESVEETPRVDVESFNKVDTVNGENDIVTHVEAIMMLVEPELLPFNDELKLQLSTLDSMGIRNLDNDELRQLVNILSSNNIPHLQLPTLPEQPINLPVPVEWATIINNNTPVGCFPSNASVTVATEADYNLILNSEHYTAENTIFENGLLKVFNIPNKVTLYYDRDVKTGLPTNVTVVVDGEFTHFTYHYDRHGNLTKEVKLNTDGTITAVERRSVWLQDNLHLTFGYSLDGKCLGLTTAIKFN